MANNYWVAYSGGIDSHVLLHFLATQFPEYNLHAVHINHQLNINADQWAEHCKKICAELNIPLKIITVTVNNKNSGKNLEAAAREVRYAAFTKLMSAGDILFTAHQQDDQAETVLLQLFRGAGLRGVSAMQNISNFADGYLVRPLLNFTREDIHTYAETYQLKWINDPSNNEAKFDRNFLRHEIMPLLQKRWPKISKTLTRFATHCAEQENLLISYATTDLTALQGSLPKTLCISKLNKFNSVQQQNILRQWIRINQLNIPSKKILTEIQMSLLNSKRKDINPIIRWPGSECRRYQDNLFIMTSNITQREEKLTELELKWCQANLKNNLNYTIQFRSGGEKFKPANSKHTRDLKKLLQEWRVPPWERDRIPLLYAAGKLIAVVGYAVTAEFANIINMKSSKDKESLC